MTMRKGKPKRVFAIVNRKGGVAKTTTAVTLAHGLSRKMMYKLEPENRGHVEDEDRLFHFKGQDYYINGHVLLIDLDPQGQCASSLGIPAGDADLGKVLTGDQPLAQSVVSADRSADGYPRPNLWLIPSSDSLERAKVELTLQAVNPFSNGEDGAEAYIRRLLERRLGLLTERFAFIIIDCPPTLDLFARAVYHFADAAIVPVKPDYLSMDGLGRNLTDLREAQLRGIDIGIHTIVPTFFVARQRLDRQLLSALEETHGQYLVTPIPRSQLVAEAPAHQQTLFEYDPRFRNPATIAYKNLVNKVYGDGTTA